MVYGYFAQGNENMKNNNLKNLKSWIIFARLEFEVFYSAIAEFWL